MDILIWQIPPDTSRNVIINKALGKLLNKKKRLLSTDAEIMKHSGKKQLNIKTVVNQVWYRNVPQQVVWAKMEKKKVV